MKLEEKKSEILKSVPKEMHGNGLSAEEETVDFEKYLKEFESAI